MGAVVAFFMGLGILGVIAYYGLIILGVIGYVMNIFHIIRSIAGPLDLFLVLRVVGVFVFPLGAIIGWF